jgi:hypothetical protein
MPNDILITVVVVLAAALVYAIHKIQSERKVKNTLYRQAISLPPAAQMVSPVAYSETVEYKLQQALNRESFLRGQHDQCEAQKYALRTENHSLRSSHAALEQDYLRQFNGARGVVGEMVALMMENDRLRQRLSEEASSRQLAELKLKRFECANAADPCHATH